MTAPRSRRRRLLAWLAGALLVLVALPFVVGSLAPERYDGRVSVVLARPPEEVWAALRDYERHPMSGSMAVSVSALPEVEAATRLPAWTEDLGRGERIVVRTLEADRPRRAVRELESEALPMTSRWEYALSEHPDGTRVDVTATTTIEDGGWMVPLFRVVLLVGGVEPGIEAQLDRIATTLGVPARYE